MAVRADGAIIIAFCNYLVVAGTSSNSSIYAYAARGNDQFVTSPILGQEGIAYIGTQSGALFAIDTYNASGLTVRGGSLITAWASLWSFNESAVGPALTPALDAVGHIFIPQGCALWVLNATTGAYVNDWIFFSPNFMSNVVLVDAEDIVFFAVSNAIICYASAMSDPTSVMCIGDWGVVITDFVLGQHNTIIALLSANSESSNVVVANKSSDILWSGFDYGSQRTAPSLSLDGRTLMVGFGTINSFDMTYGSWSELKNRYTSGISWSSRAGFSVDRSSNFFGPGSSKAEWVGSAYSPLMNTVSSTWIYATSLASSPISTSDGFVLFLDSRRFNLAVLSPLRP